MLHIVSICFKKKNEEKKTTKQLEIKRRTNELLGDDKDDKARNVDGVNDTGNKRKSTRLPANVNVKAVNEAPNRDAENMLKV